MVATIGGDGTPHAVPVEVVVHEGKVYVWCKARSRKARNVARTGRAALTAYKGHDFALVRGPARLLDAGDERYDATTRLFLTKYQRDESYGNDTLIEITPEKTVHRHR